MGILFFEIVDIDRDGAKQDYDQKEKKIDVHGKLLDAVCGSPWLQ